MTNNKSGTRKTANRICELCGKQVDGHSTTYNVNLLIKYDHSNNKEYTFNETRTVCRNCYLTNNKISRIGALIK